MGAAGSLGGMGIGMPGISSYIRSTRYAEYYNRRSSINTPLGAPAPGLGGSPFAGGSPYLAPGGAGTGMGGGIGAYSPNVSAALGPAGGMGGSPYGGVPRSISPLPGAGLGAGVGAGMGGVSGAGGAYGSRMGLPGAGAGLGMGAGTGAGAGTSMAGYPNTNVQNVPPGSTIIVKHGGRRRRHSDAGWRRRSPSVDVIQTGGGGLYGGGYGGYGAGGSYAGSYGNGYGWGMGGYGAGMGGYGGGMGVDAPYGGRGIYGPPAYGGGAF